MTQRKKKPRKVWSPEIKAKVRADVAAGYTKREASVRNDVPYPTVLSWFDDDDGDGGQRMRHDAPHAVDALHAEIDRLNKIIDALLSR